MVIDGIENKAHENKQDCTCSNVMCSTQKKKTWMNKWYNRNNNDI